jgi:uncharacterized membrane protein
MDWGSWGIGFFTGLAVEAIVIFLALWIVFHWQERERGATHEK